MIEVRLSFKERKTILKWCFEFENAIKVQRQWRHEFETEPRTHLAISQIREKFETHDTVYDVPKGKYRRLYTVTSDIFFGIMLEHFTHLPQKDTAQCAHVTQINSCTGILKRPEWKVYI
ncbi:Hypothetical predicted protein [Octopus vulgaris]|uniref:DUF4817 domain-containing protein n=1 Tax=Octopus vulgaris TaxID=6645 RepID=A0AA36BJR2_OCTVU|nr:Hypothetical predicted protein [Octopus vulgaris]